MNMEHKFATNVIGVVGHRMITFVLFQQLVGEHLVQVFVCMFVQMKERLIRMIVAIQLLLGTLNECKATLQSNTERHRLTLIEPHRI